MITILQFMMYALWEAVIGIVMWPFDSFYRVPYCETPQVNCILTDENKRILKAMPMHKFHPPAWCIGPHIQTLAYYSIRTQKFPFHRRSVCLPDGVHIALDIKETTSMSQDAPLIVMCHGLGGDATDPIIARLSDICAEKGWRSIVYVRRGHSQTSLLPKKRSTTRKVFPMHCDLDDMKYVANVIHDMFPKAPKVLCGFSAGSNIVVKYLAIQDPLLFIGGVSLCNGHNLLDATTELTLKRHMMDKLMTNNLKIVFRDRFEEIKQLCDENSVSFDPYAILNAPNCREFEEKLLPYYGYKPGELNKYYLDNSCYNSFHSVRVPLLSMANRDDPCIARHIPNYAIGGAAINEKVISIITERGGHQGWMEGWGNSWSVRMVMGFLGAIFTSQDY